LSPRRGAVDRARGRRRAAPSRHTTSLPPPPAAAAAAAADAAADADDDDATRLDCAKQLTAVSLKMEFQLQPI